MRTVLVTGGTTRLGKAIADGLERAGWRVVRSSHRADAGADAVADLSREDGADALFASVCSLLGGDPPYAVVNNAALYSGDEDSVRRVNLESPLRLSELMAGRDGGGAVVNVLDSRVMQAGFSPVGCYEETKARLRDHTLSFRTSCGRLRVNGVAPGPVFAPVVVCEKAGDTPLGRPTPEAVADAVAFLLSAEYTTGCIVPVDGAEQRTACVRSPAV